jgi:hypothetical protein
LQSDAGPARRSLGRLQRGRVQGGIPEDSDPTELGDELPQQLESLAVQLGEIEEQARDVLSRPGETCGQAFRHRIGFEIDGDDRNRGRGGPGRLNRRGTDGDDDVHR